MPVSPMRSQPPGKQEPHLFFVTIVCGAPSPTLVFVEMNASMCNEN